MCHLPEKTVKMEIGYYFCICYYLYWKKSPSWITGTKCFDSGSHHFLQVLLLTLVGVMHVTVPGRCGKWVKLLALGCVGHALPAGLHKPALETPTFISNRDSRLLLNTFFLNMNGIIIASDSFSFHLISSSVIRQMRWKHGCCGKDHWCLWVWMLILPENTSEVPWASGKSGGSWMEEINLLLIPFMEMRFQKLSIITSSCMGCVLDSYYRLVEAVCPVYLEQWTMEISVLEISILL